MSEQSKKKKVQFSTGIMIFFSWFRETIHHWTSQSAAYYVIMSIAFTQGLVAITDLAMSYLFKDDYKLSPAQTNLITGLITIPWFIKPLWGMISDSYPMYGYRRKSYLFAAGMLGGVCFASMGTWAGTLASGFVLLFLINLGAAFRSVIGEALIVENSQKSSSELELSEEDKQKEASKNVSTFFGVRSAGSFISAYASGVILEVMDKKNVFLLASLLPFGVGLLSRKLNEDKIEAKETGRQERIRQFDLNQEEHEAFRIRDDQEDIRSEDREPGTQDSSEQSSNKSNFKKLKNFLKKPAIFKPILFVFGFAITPSTGSVMFYFYTNKLNFNPEFLGELSLFSSLASVIGIYCFNKYLHDMSFKKVLVWTNVISVILGMTLLLLVTRANVALGIPDKLFCIGDSVVLTAIGEVSLMPVLVMACRICPKSIEGTMYALLMSTINFGGMMGQQFGGLFTWLLNITDTNFDNLWILILICNLSSLIPFIFLPFVKFEDAITQVEEENSKQGLVTRRLAEDVNKQYDDRTSETTSDIGKNKYI